MNYAPAAASGAPGHRSGVAQARVATALASAAWWIAVALVLGYAATRAGAEIVGALLPLLRDQFAGYMPEFRIDRFEVAEHARQNALVASVHLHTLLVIGKRVINEPGSVVLHITLGGALEPLIVAAATAAAWPQRWPARLAAALCGAALGTAMLLATVPTMMSGMVLEKYYYAFAADQIRPFVIRLPRFFEGGGRTMLSVTAGLAAAGMVAVAVRATSRNPG